MILPLFELKFPSPAKRPGGGWLRADSLALGYAVSELITPPTHPVMHTASSALVVYHHPLITNSQS